MTQIEVSRYTHACEQAWNKFVQQSKNATFLFDRRFMDYHKERFQDHSIIVKSAGKILSLLPASEAGSVLVSHGGLTYGGFVVDTRMRADTMLQVVDATLDYARGAGFAKLYYKPIPHFYHRYPAEEDLYALFRAGAQQVRIDAASAMRITDRLSFSKSKRQGVKSAIGAGVDVRETVDFASCWHLLGVALAARHGVKPAHSLAEIERLASIFPGNIRLFGAFNGEEMISCLVCFDCGQTVHVQYIVSDHAGRELGGIDAIVDHLLNKVFVEKTWFDFGISTTNQGHALNEGLSRQKEMFGARTVVYQHLNIDL